jgi:uncharacterized phiE125 gp8 family phage protein
MALRLVQVTGSEPVTLAEAKLACRVDSDITADDTYITALIKAARSQCEHLLGRTITAATYERALDEFPDGGIQLAWPHVTAISSIQYVDSAGTLQTLSSSVYTLDAREHPGWAMLAEGQDWPATLDTAGAVRVTFTTNWTEGGTGTVPEDVKSWVMVRVATAYRFRESAISGTIIAELPRGHGDGLLDRWRLYL